MDSRERAELHWKAIGLPNRTGYHVYVNGTKAASVGASPYVFADLSCGSTYTLGVRAFNARGHTSSLFSATYRTSSCPGVPLGVSLQQIDGGPNYYCSHRFTNACNAGWDKRSFFPISQDYYYCSEPASEWTGVGLNVADRFNNDCSPSTLGTTLHANHIWAIGSGSDKYSGPPGNVSTGFGAETVGWHIEEPATWSEITSAAKTYARFRTGGIAGRFLQAIFTNNSYPYAPLAGDGVRSSVPSTCGPPTMRTVMTCTSGMPDGRHIDLATADTYWFAGSGSNNHPAPYYAGFCIHLYGGSNCTSDQIGRASNYGDMVDMMRSWTASPHVPTGAIIETANGYNPQGRDITPAELNWAAWDTIVHGARWLLYFTEGSAPASAGFPTTSVGGTTMYAQGRATNTLVESLAPIINAPFALNFASTNAGGYVFPTEHLVLDNGLDIMTKYYTGSTLGNSAGTFGRGFYVFAAVRGSESQTMPKTVTFRLPKGDTMPSGAIQDVCACSPKRSTGTIRYNAGTHSFTETFDKVTDVHIIGPFH